MINKIYIIIISILIFSIRNVSGYQTALNILYVDDNNIDGPWDGTWEHPYQFIQDAVDNADDGYEIFVNNGIYYENSIIIDKPLVLNGEDVEYCIVDGNEIGSVFFIISDDVSINGFTIRNSGHNDIDSGISAYGTDNGTTKRIYNLKICDNKIINCSNGIFTIMINDCEISWNTIIHCSQLGIILHFSRNNMISKNTVQDCGSMGISLWGVGPGGSFILPRLKSRNNIISENTCINNREGIALGEGCIDNKITLNTIKNNRLYGIVIGYSMWNKITKNNIIDNEVDGYIYAMMFRQAFTNTWNENYWGSLFNDTVKIEVLFYMPFILNSDKTFLFSVYDKNPVKEPYGI